MSGTQGRFRHGLHVGELHKYNRKQMFNTEAVEVVVVMFPLIYPSAVAEKYRARNLCNNRLYTEHAGWVTIYLFDYIHEELEPNA